MSVNQIDDGAVIGYKPNLNYIKERSGVSLFKDTLTNTSDEDYDDEYEYTDTVNNFIDSCPSQALSDIDYTIENLKILIDKLSAAFKNGQWDKYNEISMLLTAIENNDKKYIKDFIEYHRNDISRSIVPELIHDVYYSKLRMEALNKALKELYYGDENISYEDAENIDNAYISQIKKYEQIDKKEKINYLSIYYDSMINKSVSSHAISVNKKIIDIVDIIDKSDNTNVNPTKVSLIKKIYDEVNDEIKYRDSSYNPEQNIEIMQKTLYNYYVKRKDLIDFYDLINASESIYLKRKLCTYRDEVNESIKEVNRAFIGNQIYLEEKQKLEEEKYYLLNIYANLNYNF